MVEKKQSKVSRRKFLEGAVVLGGAVAAGNALAIGPAKAQMAAPAPALPTPQAVIKDVPPAKGHLTHDPDICAGCRTCEAVCSLSKEGMISPELARIQVSTEYCHQCDGPECLWACPTGALHADAVTGARVIDAAKCIGCQRCLKACIATPSRIRFNAKTNKSFKCDLCGGDPLCVKFCPTGAVWPSWIEKRKVAGVKETVIKMTIQKDISGTGKLDIATVEGTRAVKTPMGLVVKGTVVGGRYIKTILDVRIQGELYDAAGTLLNTSKEKKLEVGENGVEAFELDEFATPDPAKVKKCILKITATKTW